MLCSKINKSEFPHVCSHAAQDGLRGFEGLVDVTSREDEKRFFNPMEACRSSFHDPEPAARSVVCTFM